MHFADNLNNRSNQSLLLCRKLEIREQLKCRLWEFVFHETPWKKVPWAKEVFQLNKESSGRHLIAKSHLEETTTSEEETTLIKVKPLDNMVNNTW